MLSEKGGFALDAIHLEHRFLGLDVHELFFEVLEYVRHAAQREQVAIHDGVHEGEHKIMGIALEQVAAFA